MNDDYALVQFYVPTPSVWLRLDQLEERKISQILTTNKKAIRSK